MRGVDGRGERGTGGRLLVVHLAQLAGTRDPAPDSSS